MVYTLPSVRGQMIQNIRNYALYFPNTQSPTPYALSCIIHHKTYILVPVTFSSGLSLKINGLFSSSSNTFWTYPPCLSSPFVFRGEKTKDMWLIFLSEAWRRSPVSCPWKPFFDVRNRGLFVGFVEDVVDFRQISGDFLSFTGRSFGSIFGV